MNELLLLFAIVLILCVFVYKFLSKIGVPMLLVFIGIGMLFGENGLLKISYNNFELSNDVGTIALIFIIFFGGFGTNIKAAREVLSKSVILSSLGVLLTAVLTSIAIHYVLKIDMITSLFIGAVLSSTDAASVFSILRTHKLNLKYNTASLLEIESGSNDPFAYVLTVTILSLTSDKINILELFFKQIFFGVLIGLVITYITSKLLNILKLLDTGFLMAFFTGMMFLCYGISNEIDGNGYISVYIFGILIGNLRFSSKKEIVHYFDGITSIMQMIIFFLLGLLVNPLDALKYFKEAFFVMLVMTFIIRPIVVYLLIPKAKNNQKLVISFAGLRGAASVVFSILIVVSNYEKGLMVFDIAFIVVLLSIAFQGSFLPYVSKKFDMIDFEGNVLKTFNDYSSEEDVDFITFEIDASHDWIDRKIKDIVTMPSILIVLIIRGNEEIIPNGDTVIKNGDRVVICGSSFVGKSQKIKILEREINFSAGKYIKDLNEDKLIIMIKRKGKTFIPTGNTLLEKNDILVLLDK